MGLEDGASPHSGRGSYIHGNGSPPPYLSSHSPPPIGPGGHSYASYPDNIVYTSLRKYYYISAEKIRNCIYEFTFISQASLQCFMVLILMAYKGVLYLI